jgi:predicted phage gp36 major capsid-like protein
VLREVKPTWGELYAYPQVSEWAMDDVFFNVDDWLAQEVAQEFAIPVICGNGHEQAHWHVEYRVRHHRRLRLTTS